MSVSQHLHSLATFEMFVRTSLIIKTVSQNCKSQVTRHMFCWSNLTVYFFVGSLTIVYPNLNAGNYILRIEAKTENGERAVIRRAIRIGIIITMQPGIVDCM